MGKKPTDDAAVSERHTEKNLKSGFIGQAAHAIVRYCLLPDPRPNYWGRGVSDYIDSWSHPRNHLPAEQCIKRHIAGKSVFYDVPTPAPGSTDYKHIVRDAELLRRLGVAKCQVRDFEDTSGEPMDYQGYRAANGQCAVRKTPVTRP